MTSQATPPPSAAVLPAAGGDASWRFGRLAEIMATATCALVLLLMVAGDARAATASFSYTGAAQTWTVPAGVLRATFDVYGAQGGTAAGASGGVGGRGARVRATLGVTPGEVLAVYVGGQGATGVDAAFNGGAGGGGAGGAGGGGASDVRRGAGALADRVLVAGGGGGGAGYGYGFRENPLFEQFCPGGAGGPGTGAGETTGCPPGMSAAGGGPGTVSAGGTGGFSNYGGGQGTAGQLGLGGAGGAGGTNAGDGDGGGGGGGLFGGGGGGGGGFVQHNTTPGHYEYSDGAGGGGGGGSSFIAPAASDTALTAAARTGAGLVTITYDVRPGATTGSGGPGAPGNAGPNAPAARPSIVGGRLAGAARVAKSGRFALRTRVACAGAGTACRVKVNVTTRIVARRAARPQRRTVRIGGASFSVEAGRSTRVRAKLTRTGLRLLRQRRTLKVKVRITVVRGAHTSSRTVAATLRSPR